MYHISELTFEIFFPFQVKREITTQCDVVNVMKYNFEMSQNVCEVRHYHFTLNCTLNYQLVNEILLFGNYRVTLLSDNLLFFCLHFKIIKCHLIFSTCCNSFEASVR